MDEFIENFQEFKSWLDDQQYNCPTPEHREEINKVIAKFKELHLDEAF